MRKAQIYIKKQKKTVKNTLTWGGVVSQLGGSLPPKGGVKISLAPLHSKVLNPIFKKRY